jgi:flagellar protein FlaG
VPQAASVLGLSEAARRDMAAVKAKAEAKAVATPMTLDEAVKAFKDFLKNLPSDLQFQPDQESGYVIFKVVNPVTQEVIRQYPPDEVVRMAKHLKAASQQGRSGIFLDKKL